MADMARQGVLKTILVFLSPPKLNSPTIPAKAGIPVTAFWIPAFAGMVGAGRMERGLSLNSSRNRRFYRQAGKGLNHVA